MITNIHPVSLIALFNLMSFKAHRYSTMQSLTCSIHINKALVGLVPTSHHLSHNIMKEPDISFFFVLIFTWLLIRFGVAFTYDDLTHFLGKYSLFCCKNPHCYSWKQTHAIKEFLQIEFLIDPNFSILHNFVTNWLPKPTKKAHEEVWRRDAYSSSEVA